MTAPQTPTPSLAGTAETILCPVCGHWDEQHHALGCVAEGCPCSLSLANVYYRALAERTAECERWHQTANDHYQRLMEATEELRALRASLATAQEDTRRLGLLAKWAATPMELDRMGGLDGDAPVGPFFLTFESPEVTQYSAPTLREVIDKVEAVIQNTARPHATPEGG